MEGRGTKDEGEDDGCPERASDMEDVLESSGRPGAVLGNAACPEGCPVEEDATCLGSCPEEVGGVPERPDSPPSCCDMACRSIFAAWSPAMVVGTDPAKFDRFFISDESKMDALRLTCCIAPPSAAVTLTDGWVRVGVAAEWEGPLWVCAKMEALMRSLTVERCWATWAGTAPPPTGMMRGG